MVQIARVSRPEIARLIASLKWLWMDRYFSVLSLDLPRQKGVLDVLEMRLAGSSPSDLQRSFLQYLCQVEDIPFAKRCALNLISALLVLPFLVVVAIAGAVPRSKDQEAKATSGRRPLALYLGVYPEVVPDSVMREHEVVTKPLGGFALLPRDLAFLLREGLLAYAVHPYFVLKLLYKMAVYRRLLLRYRPRVVIATLEYSFTSSILTRFCEQAGVDHYNVMHGEKLFNMRDSFFRFHRCYVWDDHYRNLFRQLRAEPGQFMTEPPAILNRRWSEVPNVLTYYLASESPERLRKIAESLRRLPESMKVRVRFHPRYSDPKLVDSVFSGFEIEDPRDGGIDESLNRTTWVASLFSTVLFQGYRGGKKIVIDDLSDERSFRKLQELGYIMLSKPHRLLSEIVR